jgi:hypothetical protein
MDGGRRPRFELDCKLSYEEGASLNLGARYMTQYSTNGSQSQSALAALRRFVRPKAVVERCELCSAEIGGEHLHLVEPQTRQLFCACQPCAILFTNRAGAKYKRVPNDVRLLKGFELTDSQWESLLIPIGLAFFFNSSSAGKVVAIYPSPAGPTESLLELQSWEDIVSNNPVLKGMRPDVEALLVNRVGEAREYFLAPIDECYKLVGLIRINWRGLSGGGEVWGEIKRFFNTLKDRAVAGSKEARA